MRGVQHALVVGDHVSEVRSELAGSRQMNRVKRAKLRWKEFSGRLEDTVIDSYQLEPSEHRACASDSAFTLAEHGPEDLGAGKRAGHHWSSSAEISA
jgi:hypothetical protein